MTQVSDRAGRAGLRYFGRTLASVSHELKNALAIINENAGLLNDYLLMAAKGMTLDPVRLKTVADRIQDQTRRADALIKHLNRFGHSVDEGLASMDLNETVTLLAALAFREAAMRQVALEPVTAASPVVVNGAPFWLLTLLGHCLTFALGAMGTNNRLVLRVCKAESGGMICMEQLVGLPALEPADFPGEREIALLNPLGATVHIDYANASVCVAFSNP